MHRSALLKFEGRSYRLKALATRIIQKANQKQVLKPSLPEKTDWLKLGEFEVAIGQKLSKLGDLGEFYRDNK